MGRMLTFIASPCHASTGTCFGIISGVLRLTSIDKCSHIVNTGSCMEKPPLIPGLPMKRIIFDPAIQAVASTIRRLQMTEEFLPTATLSKSRRCWLLITTSCVYTSTLFSTNLILPRHSVSASTLCWEYVDNLGRQMMADGGVDGNGGPGTSGNIGCRWSLATGGGF